MYHIICSRRGASSPNAVRPDRLDWCLPSKISFPSLFLAAGFPRMRARNPRGRGSDLASKPEGCINLSSDAIGSCTFRCPTVMILLRDARLACRVAGDDVIDVHELVFPAGDIETAQALSSAFFQRENIAVFRQRIMTDLIRAHGRNNLGYAALEVQAGSNPSRAWIFRKETR